MPDDLLGDRVKSALAKIGVTEEAVSEWIGAPCGCEERRLKLNSIDLWARRVIGGKLHKAGEFLSKLMGKED